MPDSCEIPAPVRTTTLLSLKGLKLNFDEIDRSLSQNVWINRGEKEPFILMDCNGDKESIEKEQI